MSVMLDHLRTPPPGEPPSYPEDGEGRGEGEGRERGGRGEGEGREREREGRERGESEVSWVRGDGGGQGVYL